jgi:iron(III) transport system substrate-binding protein
LVVPLFVAAACGGTTPAASPTATAAGTAAATQDPTKAFVAKLYDEAKKEGSFVWYAQTDEKIVGQFSDAFSKAYPGVKIDYLQLSDATQRLIAENKANQLSIDLFKPTLDFNIFKSEGLIADMTDVLTAAGVKKDNIYEGMHQDEFLVSGVSYNPDKVKGADIPKKWDDLLDPKWKGRISIDDRLRPFVNATSFWGEAKVIDYLTKLKGQNVKARSGESATTALMFAGETDLVIGAFLGSLNENKGKPWAFAPLDEVYSIVAINGWTVPPKAKHQNAAKLFPLLVRECPGGDRPSRHASVPRRPAAGHRNRSIEVPDRQQDDREGRADRVRPELPHVSGEVPPGSRPAGELAEAPKRT